MQVTEFDALIGIQVFTTTTPGIGGRLRKIPEDFIVQEIGLDGSIAPLEPTRQIYPDQPGKFIEFFLIKRNIDSIQAIRRLAKELGVSYKRFSYAGIKDRRAVTSQKVTWYRGAPQDLVGRDVPNILLLHPHRVPKPIVPGALIGNRFSIVIRDFDIPSKEAIDRIDRIQQEIEQIGGLLNFFGHQRFGVIRPTTHLVGKQILLGNFEEAIRILLGGEEGSKKENSEEAYSVEFSSQGTYERAIIQYLKKHPADYAGSFRVLPKDLARLYIHAYQSFLFNRAISERKKRNLSLTQPTIGDFVIPSTGEIHAVRMVTSSTLSEVRTKIQQQKLKVVLPLIGYDFEHITFEGAMGEILNRLLSEEQIRPDQFRVKDLPVLSSRGSFRSVLVHPTNFESKRFEEKIESPIEIKFDLPKGSYASVVLREFIKPQQATQL